MKMCGDFWKKKKDNLDIKLVLAAKKVIIWKKQWFFFLILVKDIGTSKNIYLGDLFTNYLHDFNVFTEFVRDPFE